MKIQIALLLALSTYTVRAQSITEKVDALHRQKFEWLVNSNVDSLQTLLANEVSYVHSNGWVQSRQEVLDDMQSKKLIYKNIVIEKSNVTMHGNTALVTGTGMFSGALNGTDFSVKLLYTEVYVNLNNRWRFVARHSCRVP